MSDDLVVTLAILTVQCNRIVPILQMILGTFGNLMNILIFTRRTLRTNPCSFYFMTSSINNLFVLYVVLFTRLLASGWQLDPSSSSDPLCKLRVFCAYVSTCLTQWFVVLASIDRHLCSCSTVRYRQWSTLSIAHRATAFTLLSTILAHFHVLIWWSSDWVGTVRICNIFISAYDIVFSVFYILFTCLLPPLLMIFFGLKTILNVRRLRRQVVPNDQHSHDARHKRLRTRDRQMINMLLLQVFLTIICSAPFTAINLYSTINANLEIAPMSPRATAIYSFASNICRLMNYFTPVIGFYIYSLSGASFRLEMSRILRHALRTSLAITGLHQCLPENARRRLFEHEQTLLANQSMSMTRTQARGVIRAQGTASLNTAWLLVSRMFHRLIFYSLSFIACHSQRSHWYLLGLPWIKHLLTQKFWVRLDRSSTKDRCFSPDWDEKWRKYDGPVLYHRIETGTHLKELFSLKRYLWSNHRRWLAKAWRMIDRENFRISLSAWGWVRVRVSVRVSV